MATPLSRVSRTHSQDLATPPSKAEMYMSGVPVSGLWLTELCVGWMKMSAGEDMAIVHLWNVWSLELQLELGLVK
ncbi:hypothetical protein PISMIDRAFT_17548 [Pisolithus microcarpus 441]|uniref:Unplaced genomic scaffold scaffold_273, whole genome shotgun sequence n=1 Tax=Pisolithus microcarpus 441 TaxID=765257 RepID=A0A0C9Z231_9AGAM|nr:hypothetical protein PISMIDRAFT_17548 [Pisolithus microcarpus 441]